MQNNQNINEEFQNEDETVNNKNSKEEQTENSGSKLDIKKLSKEELRALAGALINENTEMEKQLNLLKEQSEKLEKTAKKAAELSQMYSSLTKDFDNYRKRNAEIESASKDNAAAELALKIIPVFDNLKIAFDSVEGEKSKQGINLIIKQFSEVLIAMGIEEIKSEGEDFDPTYHNALMAEDTNDESLKGKVKTAFSDGYKLKEKIIKQSQVIVYR